MRKFTQAVILEGAQEVTGHCLKPSATAHASKALTVCMQSNTINYRI
jgi:ribosomal 50S subunit-recycling heat shock protein